MTSLHLTNITKYFGSFIANHRINLQIESGKIHAILGENGAGKTTLMNIVSGIYQPDYGQIYLQGKPVKITSTHTAIKLGIGMIHQHFMLVPQLSVTENIILGTENKWWLNLRQKQAEIAALSQSYGLEINPRDRVSNLPIGIQQKVEILKVLYRRAKLLILDEPTAVLTPKEVKSLINILKQLAAAGKTIIFISHKLEEVMHLCDMVTVLHRGKVVANTKINNTTPQELATLMVGRDVCLQINKSPIPLGNTVLSVENLQVVDSRGVTAVRNVSLQLRAGEVLGIAGVDGNGQKELSDAICGLMQITKGKIHYPNFEKNVINKKKNRKDKQRISAFGYIPEDRQKMGLIVQLNIAHNLILKVFHRSPFCRWFLLNYPIIQENAKSAIDDFDIRANSGDTQVSQLSGGNQQKVVLARELAGKPQLIVAMQPTRGLDVGATSAVQQKLLSERKRGAAILYISTELEEVMAMSDRIAVMYRGEFVSVLDASTATVEEIGLLMGGGERSEGV